MIVGLAPNANELVLITLNISKLAIFGKKKYEKCIFQTTSRIELTLGSKAAEN